LGKKTLGFTRQKRRGLFPVVCRPAIRGRKAGEKRETKVEKWDPEMYEIDGGSI